MGQIRIKERFIQIVQCLNLFVNKFFFDITRKEEIAIRGNLQEPQHIVKRIRN